ncbi:MAG TPA: tetratricopeptide repeat protein [Planctomycetota bacterium]|nr:tetratricopeptide repeat protein [Planctomycetota bacterium]
MRRLAPLVLALAACATTRTPAEQAEDDYRRSLASPDRQRAMAAIDQAIAGYPRAEYYAHRARLNLSLQKPDAAAADFGAAIALYASDPFMVTQRAALLYDRARLQAAAGRRTEAESDLTEAVRIAPQYAEAFLERARLRRLSGRKADAERDVEQARKVGDSQADGFYNEGVRAISQGDAAEAERMIGFALDLDPGHRRAHVAKARIHMERRQFEDAAREFDRAIPGQPEDAGLYYHRASALLAAGKPEDALRDYEKAVELSPREPSYYAARGLARYRSGQGYAAAQQDLTWAITLDADCFQAWFNRGVVEHEQKDLGAAEVAFRRANGIHTSPEGCVALGRVLGDREKYDLATDLYRQALEIYKGPEVQKLLREEIDRVKAAREGKKP